MNLNPVILAIPMYFILMAVEIIYENWSKKKTYRINDAITNINAGTLQQLTNTFIAIFKIGVYTWVYESFALQQLPQSTLTFFIALIAWDFCYYWEHRMVHTINLFWGGHIVHHQSEEYNLSVALRQTSTGFIWGLPFYLPMAILGIHPIQFALVGGINLLYQFWIHTEHINKLPRFFEYIFNTPSHHRVHHGRDPKYIDKNFAGILIIWDRMFGSFKAEEERPHYGVTTPLKSWNPVYANFAHYINLYGWMKEIRNPKDGIKLLFNKPGWFPEYMGGRQYAKEVPDSYEKYDRNINQVQYYILFQFLITLALNAFYFFNYKTLAFADKSIFASWIIVSTILFGLLFENKGRLIKTLEYLRIMTIPIILWIINKSFDQPTIALALGVLLSLISLVLFYRALSKDKEARPIEQKLP